MMLIDNSSCGTEVHDTNFPFLDERQRRNGVAILPGLNSKFGFGGKDRKRFYFQITWSCGMRQVARAISAYPRLPAPPEMARTVYLEEDECGGPEKETLFTSPRVVPKLRWEKCGDPLGHGSFGVVFPGIDVDTGRPLAAKVPKQPDASSMEGDILSQFNHVSVRKQVQPQC